MKLPETVKIRGVVDGKPVWLVIHYTGAMKLVKRRWAAGEQRRAG